ncbi:MAG: Crp/Fnr family transcriptional regulator [Agathobacter sp.]|nr:Crp/Fnr family transcriptional regulator [Agathobacter sp.]
MQSQNNVKAIMELQSRLDPNTADYVNRYLSNAPYWLIESIKVIHKKKNTVFVEENEPVDYVYMLVEGTVRAIDYRIAGVAYDYMWFNSTKTFGAMEIFYKIPLYMTTLMTVTDCTMLKISKKNYEKWIWDDKNALKMEIESTGRMTLEQNLEGRVFLFLQGTDRIVYFFARNYEREKTDKTVTFEISRQEIAERSGFSVKTVNRAIKKMEEDGYISKKGHKIIITNEQYKKMREYLDPIVEHR